MRDQDTGAKDPSGRAPPAPLRRFGDDDISRILQKAAELQERAASLSHEPGRGLTLDELRQVAAEAGIDPRFVDLAASGVGGDVESRESALAGGPVQWHYQTSVPGEIDDGDRERILHSLRTLLGRKGDLEHVFGRMEWTFDDGLGPVIVGISSREGMTEIDVSSTRTGEAGLLHGLGIPFGAMGLVGILTSTLGVSGPSAVLPLLALSAAGMYGAIRVGWGLRARFWERRLQQVVSRLTNIVQGAATLEVPMERGVLPSPPEE